MSTGLEKAVICQLDKNGNVVKRVQVMFNPKEYSLAKQNSWQTGQNPKANVPEFEFSGGQPTTLRLQLLFDTYAERKDVRSVYTNALYQMMIVNDDLKDPKNQKGRPPIVRFQWGEEIGFDAVITSLNQRFTLFLPSGIPVRAVVDVTFQEVKDPGFKAAQNPTSRGAGGERVWTVSEGDTLAWIAFNVYNDSTRWRPIADANQLTSLRQLPSGMQLEIPHV